MKKVELLFPEFCNIYGESYSVEYLKKCNSEIEVVYTNHKDVPIFVSGEADMVYLGCSSEDKQEKIIDILKKYKEEIQREIEKGTIFLVTGNALEIFGKYIEDDDKQIEAIGIFDFYSKRYMRNRHNSQYVGKFKDMIMLGQKSQYSMAYGDFDDYFIDIEIGIGMNKETKREGIRKNNFYGTYSLGPYMILNPHFTKYLLCLMGLEPKLAFEDEIIKAYDYRLKELRATLK